MVDLKSLCRWWPICSSLEDEAFWTMLRASSLLRWGCFGNRKANLCHPVLWLFIRTIPEWDVSGSYWAEPLLWPGGQASGFANGTHEAFLSFLLLGCLRVWPRGNTLRTSSPELRQSLYGGRMLMSTESTRAHLHLNSPGLVNGQLPDCFTGSRLDTCLVETKHIEAGLHITLIFRSRLASWHPQSILLPPGLFPGPTGTFSNWPQLGPLPDTDNPRSPDSEHDEFINLLSSKTKIDFPLRELLGTLGNLWGIPRHECLPLCSWRVAQITKRRVGLYS